MFDFQLTYTLLSIPLGSPPLTMQGAQDAQPGCDTNIAARRVFVTALTHLKLLLGAEIPSGWNGLLQRELFGHKPADPKPVLQQDQCKHNSTITQGCRFKEACMESKEFYGESYKLTIFKLMASLCEDHKDADLGADWKTCMSNHEWLCLLIQDM